MARPTVTKGRLVIPSKGAGRTFSVMGDPSGTGHTMMFNPNDVKDTKAVNWGSTEVPGASHPVYQFGAGGERLVSFELYVDGDRGRAGLRGNSGQGVNFGFDRTLEVNGDTLSIADELVFYRSLIYPGKYNDDPIAVFPHVILFTFGELYNNMVCICKKADWEVKFWTPDLKPVRAVIQMQLAEVVNSSQTADQFLNSL